MSGREVREEEMSKQLKVEIASHPLFDELLAAHVACLHVITPVYQQPMINYQMATRSPPVHPLLSGSNKELDQFLATYTFVLSSLKEHLQKHVHSHMREAMMASEAIQQELFNLTGEIMVEGAEATMSDGEENLHIEIEKGMFGTSDDRKDTTCFGPSVLTGPERCLMERVKQELKTELKQGFKPKIEDVREEILRKRRAGKLPGGTTSVLKKWWEQHTKWPYPTEEDKAMLVDETGLKLKQINNWFINQRKRNWHESSISETNLGPKNKK
ncbi:hypothetical protein HHK36_010888 [Tetracentron sinense]|uniref:Uncharacterized protein n=1 Tax=Tetracentron sinense TaxID=13715 RepID=A0A835DJE3_TETSI|nr:hypothetical protein HHK36_010888 [Tetracentron sinense]